MSSAIRFFFSRIFPWPFIIFGAFGLYLDVSRLHRAKESLTWPVAEGRIQNSSVEYHWSHKYRGKYQVVILYQFTVAGQTHSGNTVAFDDYESSDRSFAQKVVNRYPKDKAVPVRYLATDPDVCLLEPGIQGQLWFAPAYWLIVIVTGLLMAVFLPKVMRKQETTEPRAEGDAAGSAP
jgi:hypothetical protein